jgi:hypothetical protein
MSSLGRYGRSRTNVWDYAGANTMRQGRLEELAMHPTVKPVALVADAVLDCSKRGGVVLDCFGGSGTTLIAAEKTGRSGYLIELDPVYVDVSIKRFEQLTRTSAIHAETGLSFAEIQARRIEHTVAAGRTVRKSPDRSEAQLGRGQEGGRSRSRKRGKCA